MPVEEEGTGMNDRPAIAHLWSDASASASAIAAIALRAIEQEIVAAAGASGDNRIVVAEACVSTTSMPRQCYLPS